MRATKLYAPTLREVPAEAEIASHKLMLKAGLICKITAGMYTYLPLAWRVMKKIEAIIREEMDGIDGQELMMPIVQPAELWQASGRWPVYGEEMMRLKDRHQREYCLGPTHEEMITWQVAHDLKSYKQLPIRLYQMQSKFRDERRPRFGLMRSREFIMKDMYSFDKDEAGLQASYDAAYGAYSRIFSRCGLNFRPVEADSGAIGGSGSHEFMALADSGEAEVLFCDGCDYAANVEIAALPPEKAAAAEEKAVEEVVTPACGTIEAVANFLGLPTKETVKSLCYQADDEFVLVLIRGDRHLNEVKLQNALDCVELAMATDEAIATHGLVKGFIGPVGVSGIKIVIDEEVSFMANQVVGANKKDCHLRNVNLGRDYKADIVADVRLVGAGDACPHCGKGHLQSARGIEVGQVFKLYTKYSEKLKAVYIDENGVEKPTVMGCYGIGVGRTMAALIEQSHDDYGIIWPMAIAPYQVVIVPVNDKDEAITACCEKLYQDLTAAGVELVLDDRKERSGVKFNDADLIGYPIRVTVGTKGLEKGIVELKYRHNGEVEEIAVSESAAYISGKVKEMLK